MSRRGGAKPTGIQMFPFLAVLICTMGALVVLLHAFARHGQEQAAKTAEAKMRAQREQDELDADFFEWRVGHLREAREKTQAQLAEERLKLSHVEDHQRRLLSKLEQLKAADAQLEQVGSATADELERNEAELAETKEQLAAARQAVAKARKQGKFKAVNYSVVPFEGRNTTHRRPVYIECRDNQILLQPEGIVLTPGDFIGFFGPGNPLASALRAQREYFAQRTAGGKLAEEPYPLMLVRPDGIAAYYAARAALDSWGSEFGYELVGADWDLKFPERDPALAELTQRVIEEARQRHREYVLSSNQIARRRPRPVYHAKSHGGFAKEPGTGDGPHGSGLGSWDDYQDDWGKSAAGDGPRGTDSPGRYGDQSGGTASGSLDEYAKFGGAPAADPYAEPGGLAPQQKGEGTGKGTGNGAGQTIDGSQFADMQHGGETGYGPTSQYRGSGGGQQGEGQNGGEAQDSGKQSGQQSSQHVGQTTGEQNGPGGENNGGDSCQIPEGPAHNMESRGDTPKHNRLESKGAKPKFRNPNSEGGDGGESDGEKTILDLPDVAYHNVPQSLTAGNRPSDLMLGKRKKLPQSMADTRGEDWGLLGGGRGSIAASRPILVLCFPDRLVLVPESRAQKPQEIKLGEHTEDSMDQLVSSVWDYMKVWGKAGRGLHWRPTLKMDVRPGGEARFEEVKALLASSGLDVDRRNPPPTARQPAASPRK